MNLTYLEKTVVTQGGAGDPLKLTSLPTYHTDTFLCPMPIDRHAMRQGLQAVTGSRCQHFPP